MRFNAVEFRNQLLRMHQERGEEIGVLKIAGMPLTVAHTEQTIVRERKFIMDLVNALDSATDEDV